MSHLPAAVGGVHPDEPREQAGHKTPVGVWPVLAYMQADTPFMAASMGACGHAGHAACWRCGARADRVENRHGEHVTK